MSLLDEYGMDNWLEYDSLNQELSQSIKSIDYIYQGEYSRNIYSGEINNKTQWIVDSAFLAWILMVNYLYIYQYFRNRRIPRIRHLG